MTAERTPDPTGPALWLQYAATLLVIAGIGACLLTWPAGGGSKTGPFVLLAVGLVAAALCGVGAAVLRRRS